jgi:DNA-binding CsgD family transcriptional regulator
LDAHIPGLVSAVYDAAGDPTAWAGTLDKLADALSSATTSVILYDSDANNGNLAVSIRLDPAEQRRYNQHYAALDSWGVHGGHLLAPGKVIHGEEICTPQTVRHSEFYADFLRPNGNLLHSIVASVDRSGANHSIVALTRSASAGAFDSREHCVLAQLMPHFQRALALQRTFAELRASADWHADVVDRLPVGVAMISATGRVIELNRRARELLAKADGLMWERGYLDAQLPGESRALLALIRNAALTGEGKGTHPGGPISISRPSGRRAFRLLVCPFRPSPLWRGLEPPSATVIMTDPEQRIAQSLEPLVARYGLTFAEARLATRLVKGESIAEAAVALNITAHTARTHLKRVFAKTGTTRQPELVRQLLLDPESFTTPSR